MSTNRDLQAVEDDPDARYGLNGDVETGENERRNDCGAHEILVLTGSRSDENSVGLFADNEGEAADVALRNGPIGEESSGRVSVERSDRTVADPSATDLQTRHQQTTGGTHRYELRGAGWPR